MTVSCIHTTIRSRHICHKTFVFFEWLEHQHSADEPVLHNWQRMSVCNVYSSHLSEWDSFMLFENVGITSASAFGQQSAGTYPSAPTFWELFYQGCLRCSSSCEAEVVVLAWQLHSTMGRWPAEAEGYMSMKVDLTSRAHVIYIWGDKWRRTLMRFFPELSKISRQVLSSCGHGRYIHAKVCSG
jgi:hypothetical protein